MSILRKTFYFDYEDKPKFLYLIFLGFLKTKKNKQCHSILVELLASHLLAISFLGNIFSLSLLIHTPVNLI